MIEHEDRLPDWAYLDEELEQMLIDQLEPPKYSKEPVNIVAYHLYKDSKDTGLAMIIAVKSVADGQEAIDKLWSVVGISSIVGKYNEESILNWQKIEAIYIILEKYWYKGKAKLPGSDKIYKWEPWMAKLIN